MSGKPQRIICLKCKFRPGDISILIALLFVVVGCISCEHDHLPSMSTGGHDYIQVNLVADTAGFDALRIDTNLGNPWGISVGKSGSFWIACNNTGVTVVYDANGVQTFPAVAIPYNGNRKGAAATGSIYNPTAHFIVNGKAARFIYSTENGTITAWTTGDSTITVADRSAAGAVYKGLAMANDGTGDFIYAADFFNGKIDVFDQSFNYVTNKAFADPEIPAGFAPFNIRNINGKLFVAYAKQRSPENLHDQPGVGNGYINIFTAGGSLIRRFHSRDVLNSPWGIVQTPEVFGQGVNAILVANFGDGQINVFDSAGTFIGPLENKGTPIFIDGIWDLAFNISDSTKLYFTAGPRQETNGIFGYLKLK